MLSVNATSRLAPEEQLLRSALEEIQMLRRQVERLTAYHVHTERMLAIFEGGPRQEPSVGMGEDVCFFIRRRLDEIRKDDGNQTEVASA